MPFLQTTTANYSRQFIYCISIDLVWVWFGRSRNQTTCYGRQAGKVNHECRNIEMVRPHNYSLNRHNKSICHCLTCYMAIENLNKIIVVYSENRNHWGMIVLTISESVTIRRVFDKLHNNLESSITLCLSNMSAITIWLKVMTYIELLTILMHIHTPYFQKHIICFKN